MFKSTFWVCALTFTGAFLAPVASIAEVEGPKVNWDPQCTWWLTRTDPRDRSHVRIHFRTNWR